MPIIYALLAILIWSSLAFLGTKLGNLPPFLLVGSSLTIGSLCGIPWIREWKVPFTTLCVGIYGLFGYHFFLFLAFRNAPIVEANLINYLWPLLIVLLSPVFFKELKLTKKHILAALLGFSGAILIVTGGKLSVSIDSVIGYVLAGISAFIWASYSLLSKRIKPFSTGAVGLFCFISGILSLICHLILEPTYVLQEGQGFLLILLGLGPMGSAFFLWDKALKLGDPRIIGSLSYLTPMLSTLILIFTGSGAFSWVSGLSMGLIISGAIVGALSYNK